MITRPDGASTRQTSRSRASGSSALLEAVDHQDAVEEGVGERQGVLVHQAGQVAPRRPARPRRPAAAGMAATTRRAAAQASTNGRGVAERQHVQAVRVAPGLDDLAADHLARGAAQVGGVELAKLEDVAAHGLRWLMLDVGSSPT